ncbi:1-aminocyclopropane-1-carboxylate oxidase 3 [Liparis tanakae]|uniref:1-aminocyclopropane-1-carboxylate oxidase 3 n=1 Tax=Liparis tanakae TaxID=230148 RepID=A0A4Z2EGD6_9TELE|nr:1-aminocyclopropane-1-carboxylate oxidase 3 [Liparis tanakae]
MDLRCDVNVYETNKPVSLYLLQAEGNNSTLRPLYYPPVNRETVKEDQLRCGEHSDYGSITLLFSTSEGLQVQRRSGEFMDVPYVPGTVLINIADIMQRWTADRFVSVSLAFFVMPDDEALITCCDGSNKYPPVTGADHFAERLTGLY